MNTYDDLRIEDDIATRNRKASYLSAISNITQESNNYYPLSTDWKDFQLEDSIVNSTSKLANPIDLEYLNANNQFSPSAAGQNYTLCNPNIHNDDDLIEGDDEDNHDEKVYNTYNSNKSNSKSIVEEAYFQEDEIDSESEESGGAPDNTNLEVASSYSSSSSCPVPPQFEYSMSAQSKLSNIIETACGKLSHHHNLLNQQQQQQNLRVDEESPAAICIAQAAASSILTKKPYSMHVAACLVEHAPISNVSTALPGPSAGVMTVDEDNETIYVPITHNTDYPSTSAPGVNLLLSSKFKKEDRNGSYNYKSGIIGPVPPLISDASRNSDLESTGIFLIDKDHQGIPSPTNKDGKSSSKFTNGSLIRHPLHSNDPRMVDGSKCVSLTDFHTMTDLDCAIGIGFGDSNAFHLDKVYGYNSSATSIYASSIRHLLPGVVSGDHACIPVIGDERIRLNLIEGTKENDYCGILSLIARGLLTEIEDRKPSVILQMLRAPGVKTPYIEYKLKVSWAQIDPFEEDAIADRLAVLTENLKGQPLFTDPNLMLRESVAQNACPGMYIPGLVEIEVRDLLDIQKIIRNLYLTNSAHKLTEYHNIFTFIVECYEHVPKNATDELFREDMDDSTSSKMVKNWNNLKQENEAKQPISIGKLDVITMGNILKSFTHISKNIKHKIQKKEPNKNSPHTSKFSSTSLSTTAGDDDLSTPTTQLVRPHEWYTKLQSCVKMMKQKYPNPPFHHSRLGLLLRDAFMNKMPCSFLCLVSPYSNRIHHALSILNLGQNLYNITSKESILKEFRLALNSEQNRKIFQENEDEAYGKKVEEKKKKALVGQRSMENGCYSYADITSENVMDKLKETLDESDGKVYGIYKKKKLKEPTQRSVSTKEKKIENLEMELSRKIGAELYEKKREQMIWEKEEKDEQEEEDVVLNETELALMEIVNEEWDQNMSIDMEANRASHLQKNKEKNKKYLVAHQELHDTTPHLERDSYGRIFHNVSKADEQKLYEYILTEEDEMSNEENDQKINIAGEETDQVELEEDLESKEDEEEEEEEYSNHGLEARKGDHEGFHHQDNDEDVEEWEKNDDNMESSYTDSGKSILYKRNSLLSNKVSFAVDNKAQLSFDDEKNTTKIKMPSRKPPSPPISTMKNQCNENVKETLFEMNDSASEVNENIIDKDENEGEGEGKEEYENKCSDEGNSSLINSMIKDGEGIPDYASFRKMSSSSEKSLEVNDSNSSCLPNSSHSMISRTKNNSHHHLPHDSLHGQDSRQSISNASLNTKESHRKSISSKASISSKGAFEKSAKIGSSSTKEISSVNGVALSSSSTLPSECLSSDLISVSSKKSTKKEQEQKIYQLMGEVRALREEKMALHLQITEGNGSSLKAKDRTKYKKMAQEIKEYEMYKEVMEAALVRLQLEMKHTKEDRDFMASEKKKYENELRKKKSNIFRLKKDLQTLETDKKTWFQDQENHSKVIAKMQSNIQELKEEKKVAVKEILSLKHEMGNLRNELLSLQTELYHEKGLKFDYHNNNNNNTILSESNIHLSEFSSSSSGNTTAEEVEEPSHRKDNDSSRRKTNGGGKHNGKDIYPQHSSGIPNHNQHYLSKIEDQKRSKPISETNSIQLKHSLNSVSGSKISNAKPDHKKQRGWQYVEALEKKYLEAGQRKGKKSGSKTSEEGERLKQEVNPTTEIVDSKDKVETEISTSKKNVSASIKATSTINNVDFTSKLVGDLKKKRDQSVADMKRKTTALYERSLMRRKGVGKSGGKDHEQLDESDLSSTDDDEDDNSQDGDKILAKAEGAVLAAKRMVQQLNELKEGGN